MITSASIILQALAGMEAGPIRNETSYDLPSRTAMKFSMESLISHFKLMAGGVPYRSGQVGGSIESPKGEFGVTVTYDVHSRPVRCKFRAPGYAHLSGLNLLARNHLLADIVTLIGTCDIVFGEIDR